MDETTRLAWKNGHRLHEERAIHAPTVRLDGFMQRDRIEWADLLKISAQSGDLAVLHSAGDRLADIGRIQLEVTVTPTQLYVGAADKATRGEDGPTALARS
jgi:hypothetical protein